MKVCSTKQCPIMKDQHCWNICGHCLVPCSVLTDTTVSLSSPELGCSYPSSLCCREGSDQQVDYCVPFPFFPNWHCFSSRWSWQADLLALGKEWGRESLCASRGRLVFPGRQGRILHDNFCCSSCYGMVS